MLSFDWMCFERIIKYMENEFNGYMTFNDAVYYANLPLHYKGNTYVPEFFST